MEPANPSAVRKPKTYRAAIFWIVAVVAVFAASAGLVLARESRLQHQRAALARKQSRGPRVLVAPMMYSPVTREIRIPASIHGYIETPVYAKIAGYLKNIRVDKGDSVRKGEVLATIESPELDKQTEDARANYWLQKVTDERNQALLRQEVIAKQTADDSHAAMLQAKAAWQQLLAEKSYETITAAFDGIITARYVDPGVLIPQATAPSNATPIVALATLEPVRVYANVPQEATPFIHDGDSAIVTVAQYPRRKFEGTITRHPEALAPDTRTMLVEVDLPNHDRALLPGMYAETTFRIAESGGVPQVPDDALVFRNGNTYVPVVLNDRLHLAAVELGLDNGRSVEITQGLAPGAIVALNLGQGVSEGERVRPIRAKPGQLE